MNLISVLLRQLDRSSPGSSATAEQVLSMLGSIRPQSSLFVGDEACTPRLVSEKLGGALKAAFTDEFRTEQGREAGLDSTTVQLFELPGENGSFDLIWYNGIVEFDGCAQRLEQLRQKLKKGGTLVYRAVSWLTEPSPDTKVFCQRRFGQILPLDKVLVMAFAVCCAFLFGDHLSFTANFQPSLIVPVLVGKLCAGVCAIVFANLLAVRKAEQLEQEDLAEAQGAATEAQDVQKEASCA